MHAYICMCMISFALPRDLSTDGREGVKAAYSEYISVSMSSRHEFEQPGSQAVLGIIPPPLHTLIINFISKYMVNKYYITLLSRFDVSLKS